jgi:hypothetical protein
MGLTDVGPRAILSTLYEPDEKTSDENRLMVWLFCRAAAYDK